MMPSNQGGERLKRDQAAAESRVERAADAESSARALQEIVKAVVAAGEAIGRLELKAAPALRGPLRKVPEGTRSAMQVTGRVVTPSRAVAAISLLAVVGIVVSLLIDIPAGLDEGEAALGFEGAEAMLVEGFWVQLASSVVLVVTGPLLGRYVRLEHGSASPRARRSRILRRRRGTGRTAGVRA